MIQSAAEAHEHCRRLTELKGPNFSLGFRLLPDLKRQAVYASYSFCRLVDDWVDEGNHTDPSTLDIWCEELDRVFSGNSAHPVGIALMDSLQHFDIPRDAFEGLIQGCRQDLEGKFYPSFEDLLGYCDLVASTIGRISLAIFGVIHPRAHPLGRSLSVALQLTNILRDVREDAINGRIYLPLEDLEEFRVRPSDLIQVKSPEALLELMQRNLKRCRAFFHEAAPLPDLVAEDTRLATHLLGGVYVKILEKIQEDPLQVFQRKVELGEAEKSALFGQYQEGRLLRWESQA